MLDNEGWTIEDHVCKVCRGRVLSRPVKNGSALQYRCSTCGHCGYGNVESVCCCGVTWGVHGQIFVCDKNPQKSVQLPHEVVARGELRKSEWEPSIRKSNPVRMSGVVLGGE